MKFTVVLILLFSSISMADVCLPTYQMNSFRALDFYTVYVESARASYKVSVGYCSELPWAQRIGFSSFSGMRACRGDKLLVYDNFSDRVKQQCHIFNIQQM